jgi:hypothetical protein
MVANEHGGPMKKPRLNGQVWRCGIAPEPQTPQLRIPEPDLLSRGVSISELTKRLLRIGLASLRTRHTDGAS